MVVRSSLPLVAAVLVLLPSVSPKSSHRQLTVSVSAGTEECFFLADIKVGQVLEVEYQVTGSSAATGNNDITTRVYNPKGNVLFESEMETEGNFHTGIEYDEGDYKVCFDNKGSTWSDKTIWFETEVEDPSDDYWDDDYMDEEAWEEAKENNEDTENLFDMKIEEIKSSVHDVRINVGKMRHFQFMISAQMSKDSSQMTKNQDKINFWSVVHVLIMISVGFAQVYMVRQFFEDKSQAAHQFSART